MKKTISKKELEKLTGKGKGFRIVEREEHEPDAAEKTLLRLDSLETTIRSGTEQIVETIKTNAPLPAPEGIGKKDMIEIIGAVKSAKDGIIEKRKWEMIPQRDKRGYIQKVIIREV